MTFKGKRRTNSSTSTIPKRYNINLKNGNKINSWSGVYKFDCDDDEVNDVGDHDIRNFDNVIGEALAISHLWC